MVRYLLFVDVQREEEINTFYNERPDMFRTRNELFFREYYPHGRAVILALKACQKHRDYYRGYPKAHHPLTYFNEGEYSYQCPPEMSHVYLSYPAYNVKYKQPAVLNITPGRTSGFPPLPGRSLAARFNKPPCKAYSR